MPRFYSLKFRQFIWRVAIISVLCVSGTRAERLPIKTYTVADGLARDNVVRVRLDSRGFLWFCTAEGVSRFDGVGITNFTVADGLPDRFVNDFLETRDGTVYFATGRGLARLNPHERRGAAENFTVWTPDDQEAQSIETLFEDQNNVLWVGTSNGLYRLNRNGETASLEKIVLPATVSEPFFVTKIIGDSPGNLWIGTAGSGLIRLASGGAVLRLTTADKLPSDNVGALLEDGNGNIWVGLRPRVSDGGLCVLDRAANNQTIKKCYSIQDNLPLYDLTDLLETSDGKMWAATVNGLCLFQTASNGDQPVCQNYTLKNGLCDNVWSLTEDKDRNLWAGTACGAKRIARYSFTSYTEADGLDFAVVNSIFENSQGELFMSSNGGSRAVDHFDDEKFSVAAPLNLPKNDGGWGWQQTVWQDRARAWWFPTGAGLYRTPPTDFQHLVHTAAWKVAYGAGSGEVFRLFEDSRGDIWTAVLPNQLWHWERATDAWQDFTAEIALSPTRLISAFAEDQHGNVWIGTGSDQRKEYYEGILIRYRNGRFRVFSNTENAPCGWVRDLFLDSKGRLWIASTQDGVGRLDDPNADKLDFVRYTVADGLTSNSTASVTEDQFGRIYIGTWRGLDRLTLETGQVENFTIADGLPGSFVLTSYRDRRNNLWFATDKGLVRFVPEPPRTRQPPVILITGLRIANEPQAVSIQGETNISELDLSSVQRQLTVEFLGLGATLGEKIKYEYRLNEADWTPTDERTVNFANLATGAYRFEVRAQTADRLYSLHPATISFRIAAPVWQRSWFIALLITLTGWAIYAFYRYRLNKFLEIERTRTRIATDLHDDIGANLSKISLLSDIVRLRGTSSNIVPDEDKRMLQTIAEVSRSSVDAMRDIVWSISPDRDSIAEMSRKMRQHAEEIFIPNEIQVTFHAPADGKQIKVSLDTRRELFLIFKEAVNNAARHADCKKVEIDFGVAGDEIFLEITDDGCGFDPSHNGASGNGLLNMHKRAAKIGGTIRIQSDDGNGTMVTVRAPQKQRIH